MNKIALVLAFALFSVNTSAEPTWQGTGEYKDDYLVGTIHVGDERLKELSEQLKKRIEAVDVVAVEVDLANVSTLQQQQIVMELAMLPRGTTVTQLISPVVATKVNRYLQQFGGEIFQYEQFKPWMLAVMMVQMSYQKMGLVAEHGIDQQIIEHAKKHNKTILELETFEQQLNIFNRLFDNNDSIDYNDMLLDTLDELNTMSDMPQVMLEAWINSDISAFEKIYDTTLKQTGYDKALENVLLIERNLAWQKKLNPLLKEKSVMVATGTLHYIGPTGLPALLDGDFQLLKK